MRAAENTMLAGSAFGDEYFRHHKLLLLLKGKNGRSVKIFTYFPVPGTRVSAVQPPSFTTR